MFTKSMLTTLLLATTTLSTQGGRCSAQDIDREDGVVTISGTDLRDFCYVSYDQGDVVIELYVYNANNQFEDYEDRDYDLDDVSLIVFDGFGGNDVFRNDTYIPSEAYGGEGSDDLRGGYASDTLVGGSGKDWLNGRNGDDYLKPGTGEDEYSAIGGYGRDTFAMPGTLSNYSRHLVAIDVNIGTYDFNPNEDVERLFYSSTNLRPMSTSTGLNQFLR